MGPPDGVVMHEDRDTQRIEAFSDGVFAIAITLLVLELKVPGHDVVAARGVGHSLLAQWPSYLAYITSFVTILVMWVKHHLMFSLIQRSDHMFLYWNGLLLFFVTFLPFPTAVLAEYLLHPDARAAAGLYAATLLAISLAFDGLWRYASKQGKLLADEVTGADRIEAAQISKQYRLGPPLYLIALGLSFVSESASVVLCLLLAFFFALGRSQRNS
jgi:TMEM175 potassium channel family protein